MDNKQKLWLGCITTLGIVAMATSVNANQSDTSGHQTTGSPTVTIDNLNGNGIPSFTTFDPNTGILSGGGIDIPIELGSSSNSGQGSGTTNRLGSASRSGSGAGQKITLNDAATLLENNLDNSLETLSASNQAASASNQAASTSNQADATTNRPGEGRSNLSEEGIRRVARNNTRKNTSDRNMRRIVRDRSRCEEACINPNLSSVEATQGNLQPIIEARQVVEQGLEASKKFIEQVNKIQPEKNIW